MKHAKEHKPHPEADPASARPDESAASVPVGEPVAAPSVPVDDIPVPESGLPDPAPIAELKLQNQGLQDRLLRLQADFDNYRKRVLRDQGEFQALANEDFMRALLPVLDNAYLALQAADSQALEQPVVAGFKLVVDELLATVNRFGLEAMTPDEGEFDPNQHEAISCLPSDTVSANGIIQLFRRGYRIKDRLLRPAQVVVSGGGAPVPTDDSGKDA